MPDIFQQQALSTSLLLLYTRDIRIVETSVLILRFFESMML